MSLVYPIATALAASRRRPDDLADPNERGFLSAGTLLDMLLADLSEQPI
jgi:hypothetical protein